MVFSHELVEEIKQMVDIDQLLSMLGFVPKHRSSKEIRGCCPIHHGDNPTAFRVNVERKTFSCFSKGCHENGNDVVTLVMKVLGYGFVDAVRYLASIVGVNVETFEVDPQKVEEREIRKYLSVEDRVGFCKNLSSEIPEDLVKIYMNNRDNYYINRNFNDDILDFFEVGLAYDNYGIPRATIPVRDENYRLVGVSGRRTDNNDPPKFIPIGEPFDKSRIVYNLCSAKDTIMSTAARKVIIVEGYTDVWNLVNFGFLNTVAVMGVDVLDPQVYLLSKYCLTVFLAFDSDEAGVKAINKMYKKLSKAFKVYKVKITEGKDPGELTMMEVQEALSNAGYYN